MHFTPSSLLAVLGAVCSSVVDAQSGESCVLTSGGTCVADECPDAPYDNWLACVSATSSTVTDAACRNAANNCEFVEFSDSTSAGYCRVAETGVETLSSEDFVAYVECGDDGPACTTAVLTTFNEGTGCLEACQDDIQADTCLDADEDECEDTIGPSCADRVRDASGAVASAPGSAVGSTSSAPTAAAPLAATPTSALASGSRGMCQLSEDGELCIIDKEDGGACEDGPYYGWLACFNELEPSASSCQDAGDLCEYIDFSDSTSQGYCRYNFEDGEDAMSLDDYNLGVTCLNELQDGEDAEGCTEGTAAPLTLLFVNTGCREECLSIFQSEGCADVDLDECESTEAPDCVAVPPPFEHIDQEAERDGVSSSGGTSTGTTSTTVTTGGGGTTIGDEGGGGSQSVFDEEFGESPEAVAPSGGAAGVAAGAAAAFAAAVVVVAAL